MIGFFRTFFELPRENARKFEKHENLREFQRYSCSDAATGSLITSAYVAIAKPKHTPTTHLPGPQ